MSQRLATVGAMTKSRGGLGRNARSKRFECCDCGAESPQWVGRCATCLEWNTLVEVSSDRRTAVDIAQNAPILITEIDPSNWKQRSTGIDEVDRVLGGGLVPGSVTLLGGEPGIGKSTLLLQVLASMASEGQRVLYVSAEESGAQVRLRADRLGALSPSLWLVSETSISALISCIDQVNPDVIVVDSIQTVFDPDVGAVPGSVAQVRQCTSRLVREAKVRDATMILVGHVTKDGNLAGPRVLEHMVDTVLAFEGDRHHALRLLRTVKHRFGSTNELGLFEMADAGLVAVDDPSRLFLADRSVGISGSVVVPTVDGFRPLLVEIQALVTDSPLATPRRSAQGVDGGRLSVLLAVLAKRAQMDLGRRDVHALAVGGVKVVEPAVDLAIGLALASSETDCPLPHDLVACGEVGLGGELRQVSQFERRMAEASRLGFRRAIIPALAADPPGGIVALRASTLAEAIHHAGISDRNSGRHVAAWPTIVA